VRGVSFGNAFTESDITFSVLCNIFNSQFNATQNDTAFGIDFELINPKACATVTINIVGNNVSLPAGLGEPVAGVRVWRYGPGKVVANVEKNVSTNIYGVPGYLFVNENGHPDLLKVCFASNNIGTFERIDSPIEKSASAYQSKRLMLPRVSAA